MIRSKRPTVSFGLVARATGGPEITKHVGATLVQGFDVIPVKAGKKLFPTNPTPTAVVLELLAQLIGRVFDVYHACLASSVRVLGAGLGLRVPVAGQLKKPVPVGCAPSFFVGDALRIFLTPSAVIARIAHDPSPMFVTNSFPVRFAPSGVLRFSAFPPFAVAFADKIRVVLSVLAGLFDPTFPVRDVLSTVATSCARLAVIRQSIRSAFVSAKLCGVLGGAAVRATLLHSATLSLNGVEMGVGQ